MKPTKRSKNVTGEGANDWPDWTDGDGEEVKRLADRIASDALFLSWVAKEVAKRLREEGR